MVQISVATHFLICVRITKGELKIMADYKKLYYELFNKLTDVIEELKDIQCKMEDMYSDDSFGDSDE